MLCSPRALRHTRVVGLRVSSAGSAYTLDTTALPPCTLLLYCYCSGRIVSCLSTRPRTQECHRNDAASHTIAFSQFSHPCFPPQTPETRNSELANLFQSWRWRCAHAAGVVLNVSRMSERRCTQQGCLPSAHDLEIPEDLRHYARRHLPGSVCSRAGRPSTRLRSRGPSRARA